MVTVEKPKAATARDQATMGWFPFLLLFFRFAWPYWRSQEKWKIWAFTLLMVVLTVAQVAVPIAINLWMKSIFDALQNRSMNRFIPLTGVLLLIIIANVAILSAHLLVTRWIQINWRNWLTRNVMDRWMDAGRQYQVTYIPGEHDNPDGRVAEDARITTEYGIDLVHSLLYCALLLVSFTEILWSLSGPPEIRLGSIELYVPGHLVWVAFIYAAIGTSVALVLGQALVRTTEGRQTFEANFRFGLVHARENALAIGLTHGEASERRRFHSLFQGVAAAWNRQTTALIHVLFYSASWNVLWQAFPILLNAPRFISGAITLGVMMQAVQAFQQETAALSWPIDNLSKLADWRASVRRIMGLDFAIRDLVQDAATDGERRITMTISDKPILAFRNLVVTDPEGKAEITRFDAEVRQGERVHIVGESGITTMLFKVVAGVWPWGHGRVELPAGATLFLMPERPYLPICMLREAINYPADSAQFTDASLRSALARAGLESFATRLGESGNWEQLMDISQQQRLGFARLFLHRPSWILLHEATDALGAEGEKEMMQLLRDEFADATVVILGQHPDVDIGPMRKIAIPRSEGAAAEQRRA
jgi:vitamin B12/bleomycin/antimicrobial peptide transport system ATP-binding/permease protein